MIRKWMAGILMCVAVVAGGVAVGAEADQQINTLLEASGMNRVMGKMPEAFTSQSASLGLIIPDHSKKHVKRAMDEEVRVEVFREIMVSAMREKYHPERMTAALAWYGSPLGKRLIELEGASQTPEGQKGLQAYAADLNANPPPKERIQLIVRVVRSEEAADLAIEMTVSMTRAMMRLSNRLLPPEKQIQEEAMEARLKDLRGQITNNLARRLVLTYLYAYREVSAEDLEKSIQFYESEDGKWVKLALFTGLFTGIHQVWGNVGDKLVQYSKESQ